MSGLNKNEAMRLLFEVVSVALVWILADWILRGRGRSVHQILIESVPYVLGAISVTIWNFFRNKRRAEETPNRRSNAKS